MTFIQIFHYMRLFHIYRRWYVTLNRRITMILDIKGARYELEVKNGEAIVSITQLRSKIGFKVCLYAADLLPLLNNGGESYLKKVDGNYISLFFNLKNGHLYTSCNGINAYLPNSLMLNALKKELTDLSSATYVNNNREGDLPW